MIILGIDPGLRKTGYGFIKKETNGYVLLKAGLIKLDVKQDTHQRLYQLHRELNLLSEEIKPDCMAIEKAFVGKNARSAFLIGEARAACILSAMEKGVDIFEYAPRAVKQGVTGYGDATKEQLQKMVKLILNHKDLIEEDASDALAVAIFHGNISESIRLAKK